MTDQHAEGPPSRGAEDARGLARRAFLVGLGGLAGLALGRGLGAYGFSQREVARLGFEETLLRLHSSLTSRQRELIVLPADHPSRQLNNTIAFLDRPHLGTLLSPHQRALTEHLCATMLSPAGRDAFAGTLAVEGRLEGSVLAIYGEPGAGAQAVIMGGHVNLRGGGPSPGGAAFGGGIAYGHQVGNHRWRVEGNAFAPHGEAANRVFAALDVSGQRAARSPSAPHELVLQVQGAGGRYDGVRIGTGPEAAREAFRELLETVFAAYPAADRAEAFAAIDAQGGPDTLHFAVYESKGFYADMVPFASLGAEERERRGDPYWQVWRIEGPGAVIHFQGHPHVHAYIQIEREPGRANVGETLAEADARIQGEPLRRLLEAAMRRATGLELAFHGAAVPGRVCPGPVTTGVAWSLDPFGNRVVEATIEGRAMAPALRERLAAAGREVGAEESVRIASTDYFVRQPEEFGVPERVEVTGPVMREAIETQIREDGLRGV